MKEVITVMVLFLTLYYLMYNSHTLYRRFKSRFELVPGKQKGLSVDMTYCITMDNREEYVRKIMGELKTEYTIFHAVTPASLSIIDYMAMSSTYIPYKNPGIYKKPTRLPLGISFFMCYYDAYIKGYDTIMILEDDIEFKVSSDQLVTTVKEWNSTPCEFMYLGYCHLTCKKAEYTELTPNVSEVISDSRIVCNHATLLKKSVIQKYCKKYWSLYMTKQNDNILDEFLRTNNIRRCIPPRGYINQNVVALGSNNGNKNDNLHTCHTPTNTKLAG